MAQLNSIEIPTDNHGVPIPNALPFGATLAQTYDATISASTEITLNEATTVLIIHAISQMVFLKWGTDDVTSSNFDEAIPANETRILKVPAGTTAINLIQAAATANVAVVEK